MENNKKNILESWIMVEHLAEGDINLRDKATKTLDELQEEDYYNLFLREIKKKNLKSYQPGGIVVYLGVFKFNEVIELMRNKYHLCALDEELQVGDKFSFAVYFDKQLRLIDEMTFFTESYYIKRFQKVPRENEFATFEEDNKKSIEQMFDCPQNMDYGKFFNEAIKKIVKKYAIELRQCRMKAVSNLETDETNLHSFFVDDLEKAKTVSTDNLETYLLGKSAERIDLDCRATSTKFNPNVVYDILQPCNYPLSRFPSNPQYALSLMQQIAVNLAIGYDNKQMRSVNGPPGTGKTTLLKDIFAELVVEQAYEIARLSERQIKGSAETKYWNNACIGIMPEKIAGKGIVVASSNNGAVKNIVNELPLLSGIGEMFKKNLLAADYFTNISNSRVSTKWNEENNCEELVSEKNDNPDKFWGTFSLEGGKKDNMEYIITVVKHIVHYLKNTYEPDKEIYDTFMAQYEKLNSYKNERQNIADLYSERNKLTIQLKTKETCFLKESEEKEKAIKEKRISILSDIDNINIQMEKLDDEAQEHLTTVDKTIADKNSVNQCIQALALQKPGFFTRRKIKLQYKDKMRNYSEQLLLIIEEERKNQKTKIEIENKRQEYNKIVTTKKQEIDTANTQLANWIQKTQNEILKLKEQIENCRKRLEGVRIHSINMDLEYDGLQKSNPWFDEEYRKMQSELFIGALKVRKQFLYENLKSVQAAYIIWSKQKDYLDKKIIIVEAWNWINMTVPIISSTFASFSRMCANLGKETLGHLFIDEAGQALPQASVGAIFRSKHVMVVGDPAQIKPVLTLDSSILSMLGEHFGVSKKYLSDCSSTQTLVDEVSQYGFYKDLNKGEWIGIPLWVHRRCKYPMFSISNKISYGNNMVQGIEEYGKAEWYDVPGNANDKYVKEQGVFLREIIAKMIKVNPDIIDRNKKDIVYIISPFKNVAFQLSQELKKINFTRFDEHGKPTNIGTVHTFQGKEANIVFMVLGADSKCRGAANWAVGTENPNIMNVAVTRAKEEFYIIGDKKLYIDLKSDVINDTSRIIEQFNASK